MRNKSHAEDDKMHVARFKDPAFVGASANDMASALLHKESRGPGDTIEAAAYRCQHKYGVDAQIVLQGWQRHDIKEMKASRWLALFRAWWAAGCAKTDALYAAERGKHADASWIVGLADFVAGQKDGGRD